MTKQEQIKEIAKIIAKVEFPNSGCWDDCNKCFYKGNCDYLKSAERIYDAGWRKQIEAEWTLNLDGSGTCGHCHFTQRGVYDQDSYQRYCGCCGAKMKLKGE